MKKFISICMTFMCIGNVMSAALDNDPIETYTDQNAFVLNELRAKKSEYNTLAQYCKPAQIGDHHDVIVEHANVALALLHNNGHLDKRSELFNLYKNISEYLHDHSKDTIAEGHIFQWAPDSLRTLLPDIAQYMINHLYHCEELFTQIIGQIHPGMSESDALANLQKTLRQN